MQITGWVFLLFGLTIVATHFLEGVTGFGCTVMAMPFSILLLGLDAARPVLTLYGFLMAVYIIVISHRKIQWKHFFKMISALILGLPLGILFYNYLSKDILQKALGVFMILISVRGLLIAFQKVRQRAVGEKAALFCAFCGGIIHGAFSSGGPLVIIYAAENLKDKSEFRATLCMVWFTLNGILLAQMIFAGQFPADTALLSLSALPFLAAGAVAGNIAHKKIRDVYFTKIVYTILFLTGFIMLI